MDIFARFNNLSLPVTIIVASIILGGFYFASEVNKQRSIEKQQLIKIEQERQEQINKSFTESRTEEKAKQLLNTCITNAEIDWQEWGRQLVGMYEDCKVDGGGTCVGAAAFTDAHDKNDAQLQQNKSDCFRKYPQ